MATIKALTLWQPYASAIVLGLKKFETRSWATKYRGRIAIHSSLKPLSKSYLALAEKYGISNTPPKIPLGKVLAICELEDCILMDEEFIKSQDPAEIDFGDWRIGRYAWKLRVVEIFHEPKSTRGYQGLWNLEN